MTGRDRLCSPQSFSQPDVDYHALAPEIILGRRHLLVLLVDLFLDERSKWALSTIAGLGLLAAFLPIVTLAVVATDVPRSCSAARYVVDDFSLVLKALFLLAGYVVVLMSTNYIEEGDYYQGEYYFLLLVVAARHGDDGVVAATSSASSSPSSCSRSPPTCWPPGASAT